MRKLQSGICVLCLMLIVPLALRARGVLPVDTGPLVAARYGGWAGVLRLWVIEGWAEGCVPGWLNGCIASFEKAHPGVYVQPEYVDAGALGSPGDGIPLPDLALFPPGTEVSAALFDPLPDDLPLRAGLAACGVRNGIPYAAPVLMGGYAWAWNADRLDRLPDTWAYAAMACPPPESGRQWGAALLGLCARKYSEADAGADVPPVGEVELGLPQAESAPSPAPASPAEGTLDCRLPQGFGFSASAWQDFANGDIDAMPVTFREIRRLAALSGQGRGPEWRLGAAGSAFTDQYLALGILRRAEDDGRRALCFALLRHLLSDECQGALHRAGACSVTSAPSGFQAGDAMAVVEAALRGDAPLMPNLFDAGWQDRADDIVHDFIRGDAPPSVLWRKLKAALSQKPEH